MATPPQTHYEALGIESDASPQAIRAAFRKLALKYHPDRSKDPATVEKFLDIKSAYEVLSDPERRKEYDRILKIQEQIRAKSGEIDFKARIRNAPETPNSKSRIQNPKSKIQNSPETSLDIARLVSLFGRGRFAEAERLASAIIERAPKQAVPYAVLADIVRARGDFHRAAKLYAFAVQMDPRNSAYLRKQEELVEAVASRPTAVFIATQRDANARSIAPFVGFFMAVLAAVYVVVGREQAVFPRLAPVSTWTLGILAMLFLSGAAVGASLSIGDLVDRFQTFTESTTGRLAPSVALLFIALANFWAAVALYVQAGLIRRYFPFSTTRLLLATSGVVGLMTLGASLSDRIDPAQVALWGGNVAYLGAVCGWMVADSLKG